MYLVTYLSNYSQIKAIKDQFNKENDEAERRLTMLFTLLEGMKYDVHQL